MNIKEVDFHTYCPLCTWNDYSEDEEPCRTCILVSFGINRTIPIHFERNGGGLYNNEKI